MHSQASFPRSVALAQLPSPSACSLEVVIWYTDLLEIPISHRGLEPHKLMPMTGVPMKCTEVDDGGFFEWIPHFRRLGDVGRSGSQAVGSHRTRSIFRYLPSEE